MPNRTRPGRNRPSGLGHGHRRPPPPPPPARPERFLTGTGLFSSIIEPFDGGDMNPQEIYVKTEKGREEIQTRRSQLPPPLRTLPIMIDGRSSAGEILKQ